MAQKILIVDDNPATRGDLVTLLADAGFDTMTASTVPEAMRALATATPNLLITEIRLDSYNGLHLIAMAPKPMPIASSCPSSRTRGSAVRSACGRSSGSPRSCASGPSRISVPSRRSGSTSPSRSTGVDRSGPSGYLTTPLGA